MTTVARLTLCLAAAALLAGCGSAPSRASVTPAPSAGPPGVLLVHAQVGPTCPVERVGAPPCVAPASVEVRVVDPDGVARADVHTSAAGDARITLGPGSYTVEGVQHGTFPRPPQPQAVHLTAGQQITVTLEFDTGIR